MRTPAPWLSEDRARRSVRRATLRIPSGAPRHRLAAAMEEALRLVSLPGEERGLVYYFRSVQVLDLPLSADRRIWLERFQHVLWAQAAGAVHGADSRADAAPVVFFRGRGEALEILLHRILRRRAAVGWFWPMVLRGQESASSARAPATPVDGAPAVHAIIETLRATEPSWVAVAAALFAAPYLDTAALFDAVPVSLAQAWIAEIEDEPALTTSAAEARVGISSPALRAINEAVRLAGVEDPRTVWLAALAVLEESPSALSAGTAVRCARAMLRNLAPQSRTETLDRPRAPVPADGASESPVEPVEPVAAGPAPIEHEAPARRAPPALRSTVRLPNRPSAPSVDAPAAPPQPWSAEGLPTSCAGLFFLLNAMHRLGIEAAVSGPDFVSRLLERLAAYAGADPDDAVVVWLASLRSEACEPHVERSLREWAVAVRRWCWRTGRVTAREVILRDGIFNVNRTNIDISLQLDEADVRIRRIGLDLDPGWLPWFGRVVRFHYVYRKGIHG